MLSSFRPQINQSLQNGIGLDISILEKYGISDIVMNIKKDYSSIGLVFSDWWKNRDRCLIKLMYSTFFLEKIRSQNL